MASTLDVVGLLMVEMGENASIRVEGRGDRVVVALPGLRQGIAILRRWPGGRRGRGRAIGQVHDRLVAAGLGLEVRVGPSTIGRLGVGARANLASRLLGVAPMEVNAAGLLASRRGPAGRSDEPR